MHEAVKGTLNSSDASCISVQNPSSRLLHKNIKIRVCGTVILCVDCNACETPSVTLRKNVLRVFKNRVLGKIFEPKRAEVPGDWRGLHREECHDLYCTPDIFCVVKSKKMRWVRHVT
jgi:hypothetical protein